MVMTSQSPRTAIQRLWHVQYAAYDEIHNQCIGANDYDGHIFSSTSYYCFLQKGRKSKVCGITSPTAADFPVQSFP
jgi:hypothetical protein